MRKTNIPSCARWKYNKYNEYFPPSSGIHWTHNTSTARSRASGRGSRRASHRCCAPWTKPPSEGSPTRIPMLLIAKQAIKLIVKWWKLARQVDSNGVGIGGKSVLIGKHRQGSGNSKDTASFMPCLKSRRIYWWNGPVKSLVLFSEWL